jgi:hypothetical protein
VREDAPASGARSERRLHPSRRLGPLLLSRLLCGRADRIRGALPGSRSCQRMHDRFAWSTDEGNANWGATQGARGMSIATVVIIGERSHVGRGKPEPAVWRRSSIPSSLPPGRTRTATRTRPAGSSFGARGSLEFRGGAMGRAFSFSLSPMSNEIEPLGGWGRYLKDGPFQRCSNPKFKKAKFQKK